MKLARTDFLFQVAAITLVTAILSACPDVYADGSGDGSHGGHSLGLSEDVVAFEEFAQDIEPRQLTLTEELDDLIYPENKERLEIL